MLDRLQNLLKIHKGEGVKVLQFALLAALLQIGIAIGVSTADSLFLNHVGADKLPHIYIITPFVMMIYIPIYSYLMSRLGIDTVFDITLGLLVAGGIGLHYLLGGGAPPHWVYYVAKLYTSVWYIAVYTLYWNFADSYFDILDAKRLFPLFGGGAAIGAIVGGSAVTVLTEQYKFPVEFLFLIWAALCVVSWPVALVLRRTYRKIESDTPEDNTSTGFVKEVKHTFAYLREAPFVRILIAVCFLLVTLTTLNDYQFAAIFSQGRDDRQLASLFGRLYAVANGISLFLNFFVFNRLVLSLGVGVVAFVAPATFLITFTFYLLNYGFSAGLVGFFAYNSIIASIDYNNWNLLYNAIPASTRRQVRTFIDGLCDPLATATIGVGLLIGSTTLSPENISVFGIALACVFLALIFILRVRYLSSMVGSMRKEFLDFSRAQDAKGPFTTGTSATLDTGQTQYLIERTQSKDPNEARLGIETLWYGGAEKEALDALVSRISDSRVAGPILETALHDDDGTVVRRLIDYLEQANVVLGPRLRQTLAMHGLIAPREAALLLNSPNPDERAIAVAAAWRTGSTDMRRKALEAVTNLLTEGKEETHILAGLRAISHSGEERYTHAVAAYLSHPSTLVRRVALSSVRRLATRDSSRLIPALLSAIRRAEEEDERLLALDALAQIADADAIRPLLGLTVAMTPYERRRAEATLVTVGLKAIPATITALRDELTPYKARSVAARALARLSPAQLQVLSEELCARALQQAYASLMQHYSLAQAAHRDREVRAGVSVLSRLLLDQRSLAVEFVLELLTLGGRLPDFELLTASLRSSNKKERANAIETIEQGTSRHLFRLLFPLIDGRSVAECVATTALIGVESHLPNPGETIESAVRSSMPLIAAAGAQALHETALASLPEPTRHRLRERLKVAMADEELLRTTVLTLLARDANHDTGPTQIENIYELARVPLFAEFTISDLEVLASQATPVRFTAGDRLFVRGEPASYLFAVTDGEVQVGDSSVGSVLFERGEGEVVGMCAALGRKTHRETGTALSEVAALRLSASALRQAARTYPRVALALLKEGLREDDPCEPVLNPAGKGI